MASWWSSWQGRLCSVTYPGSSDRFFLGEKRCLPSFLLLFRAGDLEAGGRMKVEVGIREGWARSRSREQLPLNC